MKYTVGSLYAGVGGICEGFIQSDFNINWANEFDKNACITYRENFSHTLYAEDIWQLDFQKLSKVDVIAGGFPCQPFSIAGYMKGFSDERGNHFFRIMKLVETIQPKVIFLENVKNLKGHDKGKTFKIIEEAVRKHGYSFHPKVMNSKEYGNIPQNRERIYIVCFKNNAKGEDEFGRFFRFPEPIELEQSIHDIISDQKVDEKYYYRSDKYNYEDLIKDMKSKDTVYQWRRHYVRENKQQVCPTLTANMGTGGHNVPLVLTKYGIRKLTPQECFKFQGFPENYKLPNISNASLYKQAGNSVTVSVIRRIAKNIKSALDQETIAPAKQTQLKLEIYSEHS